MAAHPVSPLAPEKFPDIAPMAGVRFAATAAGIRYQGRNDLLLAEFAAGTTVAGVFTRNRMPGAPVDWCRAIIKRGTARGLVVNAGNANVFTGKAGAIATRESAKAAAAAIGCDPKDIYLASTGVIGQPLPHGKIVDAMPGLHSALKADAFPLAAQTIMTTDTFPKGSVATAKLDGQTVRIAGFCKGSGMIQPDMATMLCFLFTDAKLPAKVLQALLAPSSDASFNCMTVDGDTSTSDTVLLFATGQATHKPVARAADPRLKGFRKALDTVLRDLAIQVARDGEGASKFMTVTVKGAASAPAARRIAFTVANSPLVKTAIAGEDANWGRVVMAVGRAGEKANRDKLKVWMGGVRIAFNGAIDPKYDEASVMPHMRGREIDIVVDVGVGKGAATVWSCDLTHGYIDINGSYRS
jgi:glutamate N-acetyltransferase / amino-acid N-acetyltransferase